MVERPQTASELLSEVRNLRTEILMGQPPPPATAPAARGRGPGGILGGKQRSSAAARMQRVRAKRGAPTGTPTGTAAGAAAGAAGAAGAVGSSATSSVAGGVRTHDATPHSATPHSATPHGATPHDSPRDERGGLWQQLASQITFVRAHEVREQLGRGVRLNPNPNPKTNPNPNPNSIP